jgi:predicted DNA-binding protein (UPF0251 family)/predicted Fe-Mo cluster-binding NifX family protein
VPEREVRRIVLPADGLEALRLADLVGLEQAAAARRMGVSRQTFGRILAGARRVVAQAVVGGLGLGVETPSNVAIRPATPGFPEAGRHRRIAVSAHAASLDAAVAPRFGRAPGFLVVDPGTLEFDYVENAAAEDEHGLGLRAAARIAEAGAGVLLTGFVGAKAARALAAAGIAVADGLGALTVREAVGRFAEGAITPAPPEGSATTPADDHQGDE